MTALIGKAAVIGAGTMGSGIAAQFANAGVPVALLDIVPKDASDRSILARSAVARQLKIGGFMHPDCAALVTPGNLEDDLRLVADADWIVEAIVENESMKRELYGRLQRVCSDDAIVSSNTSTISRARLTEGFDPGFSARFVISHFFNPPRYMRLLEIVTGQDTPEQVAARIRLASDEQLGKSVVDCRDTPGFIANRLGCYWMSTAVLEAIELGLSVEEADAIAGRPFGIPSTGIFGLLDLVGLDLIPGVWGSLYAALPADDPFQLYNLPDQPLLSKLIKGGRIGRKSGGGFYRQTGSGAAHKREAIDLVTGLYRPLQPPALASLGATDNLTRLIEFDDRGGRYAWKVLSRIVSYAARVGPEIADDIATIDLSMQLGYNWAAGPFALADRVGVARIAERLAADGEQVPDQLAQAVKNGGFYQEGGRKFLTTDGRFRVRDRRPGVVTIDEAAAGKPRAAENAGAVLWDIGDGIASLELRTKLNKIDERVLEFIERLPDEMQRHGFRALVIGVGNTRAFSVGGDLNAFSDLIVRAKPRDIERFITRGQQAFRALKFAQFPTVAAGSGMALGGGAELLMHCSAAVVHSELAAGFPEVNVGIVPAWGGCTELLLRICAVPPAGRGPAAAAARVFETIFTATVSKSALDARHYRYLRPTDMVVMNLDRVLAQARSKAIALVENGYTPPVPATLSLPGRSARAALINFVHGNAVAGRASKYDEVVADALATVVTGGDADPLTPVTEEHILRLECEANMSLVERPETLARMRHMLSTGKPLRN